ncbi:MAG: hypothetical protein ACD_28C00325G0002 [uncultured bacterium]|nr:MAG: hypothetical protein ACD_28C00325G0002 [uncultured bacterium]KKT74952.1 MAG: hypothetical protein UW70_C0042G0010 [Candidatus Peregrinibacteria bacterium GW2011_GWA2_44_7]
MLDLEDLFAEIKQDLEGGRKSVTTPKEVPLDEEANFQSFMQGRDPQLTLPMVEALSDIVFRGAPRFVRGYHPSRIQTGVEAWLEQLSQNSIYSIGFV